MVLNKDDFPSLKARWLHLGWQYLLFSAVYYTNLHYADTKVPVPSVITSWDQMLPNIRWMILPYFTSVLFFLISFLRPQSRASLLKLSQRISLSTLCAGIVFFIMPLSYGEVDKTVIDLWTPLYEFLYQVDLPYNQLPSLHVTYAVIFLVTLWPRNILLKTLLLIASGLLISSTVFTQQHHLADVVAGLLLATLIITVTHQVNFNPISFFYFSATVAMFLLAAIYSDWFFLMAYLALNCAFLAYAYKKGHDSVSLLAKKSNGRFALIPRLVLLPYFFCYWGQWALKAYKSKAFINIEPRIFCGRHLTLSERNLLPENCRCVDLGTELSGRSELWLDYASMPLLDLAPIDYDHMLPICQQIQKWQQQYPQDSIYIHCTMGISRSLATVLCYRSFQHGDIEQLKQYIQEQRPQVHLPEHYLSQKVLASFRH